jgi:hypothetical protein
MATKKKRVAGRAVKRRTGQTAKKSVVKKERSSNLRGQRRSSRQASRKKRTSKSVAVRRKERKVDEARRRLIEAEKEFATEELPKLVHPATKKRGADPHVPSRSKRKRPSNPKEAKLEQGLEESMAGSDPVSVTQPAMPIAEKPDEKADDS